MLFSVAAVHGTEALARTLVGVGQALLLRFDEGGGLDQDALALIALAGARPLHDHRLQCRVLPGATCERGITAGLEVEVIQVCARQAQHPVAFATE